MATAARAAAATPAAAAAAPPPAHALHEKMSKGPGKVGMLVFGAVLIGGLIFIGTSIAKDLADIRMASAWPPVRTLVPRADPGRCRGGGRRQHLCPAVRSCRAAAPGAHCLRVAMARIGRLPDRRTHPADRRDQPRFGDTCASAERGDRSDRGRGAGGARHRRAANRTATATPDRRCRGLDRSAGGVQLRRPLVVRRHFVVCRP